MKAVDNTKYFMEILEQEVKDFIMPSMPHRVGSLRMIGGAILLATPNGKTSTHFDQRFNYEECFTLDLGAWRPEDSLRRFQVPSGESRVLGKSQLICRSMSKRSDDFQVIDLFSREERRRKKMLPPKKRKARWESDSKEEIELPVKKSLAESQI